MNSKTIHQARIAAGLSQAALAESAGVSRSLVAFSERGLKIGEASQQKIERALKRALASTARKADRARQSITRGKINPPQAETAPAA
jgi:transcriptional regulator with XRE-family HTH domain